MGFVFSDWCDLLFHSHYAYLLYFATAAIPFAIHPSEGSVYGPDVFVCGILPIFPKLQFFFHLLPVCVFLLSFVNSISDSVYLDSACFPLWHCLVLSHLLCSTRDSEG